jgi:hypothetical protein
MDAQANTPPQALNLREVFWRRISWWACPRSPKGEAQGAAWPGLPARTGSRRRSSGRRGFDTRLAGVLNQRRAYRLSCRLACTCDCATRAGTGAPAYRRFLLAPRRQQPGSWHERWPDRPGRPGGDVAIPKGHAVARLYQPLRLSVIGPNCLAQYLPVGLHRLLVDLRHLLFGLGGDAGGLGSLKAFLAGRSSSESCHYSISRHPKIRRGAR